MEVTVDEYVTVRLRLHPEWEVWLYVEYLVTACFCMEMVLKLNDDKVWAQVEEGKNVHVTVQKIDTGAGEVIFDEPPVVAKVEADVDDNNCDDSCEWALDGICDDGSGKERDWEDDDYGGFYGYDDNYDDTRSAAAADTS